VYEILDICNEDFYFNYDRAFSPAWLIVLKYHNQQTRVPVGVGVIEQYCGTACSHELCSYVQNFSYWTIHDVMLQIINSNYTCKFSYSQLTMFLQLTT